MKKVFAIAAVLGMWAAGGALAADLDSATTSAAYGVKQQADEAASKVQHFKATRLMKTDVTEMPRRPKPRNIKTT